jgi:hypothetical protein
MNLHKTKDHYDYYKPIVHIKSSYYYHTSIIGMFLCIIINKFDQFSIYMSLTFSNQIIITIQSIIFILEHHK